MYWLIRSALTGLSKDIAALHAQQESVNDKMCVRSSADDRLGLGE